MNRRTFMRTGMLSGVTAGAMALDAARAVAQTATPPAASPPAPAAPAVQVSKDSRLGKILAAKKLVVGISIRNRPGAFRDDSGKPAGYYVETSQRLADDLGVPLEIADQEFQGLIPGVISGKIDLASQGLSNTPARARSMFFSTPYIPWSQILVVPAAKKKASYDEYNQAGVRLVALQGSTESQLLQYRFPRAQFVGLPDHDSYLLEVASGRADGAVIAATIAAPFLKANPRIAIFDSKQPLGFEYGALAMQYGDWELKNWVDEWLRYQKARGWLQATYNKWYAELLGDSLAGNQIPRY